MNNHPSTLRLQYNSKGYVVLKNLISSKKQVYLLRQKILNVFASHKPNSRMLLPSDVIEFVPEVLNIQTEPMLIETLKNIFGSDVKYVNDFQIQKNMSVLKSHHGWHCDAGSQVSNPKVNGNIFSNSYQFAKIGIYLQSNSPWGGSICISRFFSRKFKFLNTIICRVLNSPLTPNFIHQMLTINIDSLIEPGDAVIFDCRLLHRSSLSNVDIDRKNSADLVIDQASKLSIYFEVGNPSSCETFLKNSLFRAEQEEIDQPDESFFCDYLRFTEENFDQDYLHRLKFQGVGVALARSEDRDKASHIYRQTP